MKTTIKLKDLEKVLKEMPKKKLNKNGIRGVMFFHTMKNL